MIPKTEEVIMRGAAVRRARYWELTQFGLLLAMYILLAPFLIHAVEIARSAFGGEAVGKPYLFVAGGTLGNAAMLLHVTSGVVLTLLVPLQLLGAVRRRFTALHRGTGALLVVMAILTSLGGMTFIAVRGTVGGPVMSIGFALYGFCMFVTALRLIQTALSGDRIAHWQWALRFFWLAISSWLYRLHYVVWYLITGGAWSNSEFTGAFDMVQNFAFYIPYLLIVQIWIVYRLPVRLEQRHQ